jgi:hypothetical protein
MSAISQSGHWGQTFVSSAHRAILRCTKNAFPATYLQKITTTFSSITRLRPELKPAPPVS